MYSALQIRYGWTPEQISLMTRESILRSYKALQTADGGETRTDSKGKTRSVVTFADQREYQAWMSNRGS